MTENAIRFLLNNQLITLGDCDPNMTVLQYLRNTAGLTGTKEGCASGDCGACTVTLVELKNGQLDYQSINACITLLPALDGKQLLSVEHLQQGSQLHPVQQAMVDQHASQCGFCTPGFVMSLFTLSKNHPEARRDQITTALAGNLCRCTGYRSILDAANASKTITDQFDAHRETTIKQLESLADGPLKLLSDQKHSAYSPTSLEELSTLFVEQPEAKLLAGGTDLVLEITQQLQQLQSIIYLGNVPELHQLVESDSHYQIGAALPMSQIEATLQANFPAFSQMLERLGSLQIRNQASLGGNIGNASPIADTPPVLIALGASLGLRRGSEYRELALAEYYLDYKLTALQAGEFIQTINLPKPANGQLLKVYKISKRFDDDISAVLMALNIQLHAGKIESLRIAFGGMAAIPKRASHCEAALLASGWNQHGIEQAATALEQDFKPLSDVRASAEYRMQVAKNLLQKCYLEIEQPAILSAVTRHA